MAKILDESEVYIKYDKDFIIQPTLNNKLLTLLACIRYGLSLSGKYTTSIEHIVKSMGYKPDRHKGKLNDQIIELLEYLELNNYIFILPKSIRDVSANETFVIRINKDNDVFDTGDKPYVKLTEKEFNKIAESVTHSDKAFITRVFLNIKKYFKMDEKIPFACPSQETLAKESGVSKGGSTDNPIEDIKNMCLLYESIIGSYIAEKGDNAGKRVNARNIFTPFPIDIETARQIMLDYYNNHLGTNLTHFDPVARPGAKIKRDKKYQEWLAQRSSAESENEEAAKAAYDLELERLSDLSEDTDEEVEGEFETDTNDTIETIFDSQNDSLEEAESKSEQVDSETHLEPPDYSQEDYMDDMVRFYVTSEEHKKTKEIIETNEKAIENMPCTVSEYVESIKNRISSLPNELKNKKKNAIIEAGLPFQYIKITDIQILKEIYDIIFE